MRIATDPGFVIPWGQVGIGRKNKGHQGLELSSSIGTVLHELETSERDALHERGEGGDAEQSGARHHRLHLLERFHLPRSPATSRTRASGTLSRFRRAIPSEASMRAGLPVETRRSSRLDVLVCDA